MSDRPVIVNVDRRYVRSDGSQVSITDVREVHEAKEFKGASAVVRRMFGVTLNQGNYESCRVDVGVEVPCYLEDVERADEWAREFCEKRIREEVLLIKPEKKTGPL